MDDRGTEVRFPAGQETLSCSDRLRDSPFFVSSGYQGVKRPECDTDHSVPSSIELKGA